MDKDQGRDVSAGLRERADRVARAVPPNGHAVPTTERITPNTDDATETAPRKGDSQASLSTSLGRKK